MWDEVKVAVTEKKDSLDAIGRSSWLVEQVKLGQSVCRFKNGATPKPICVGDTVLLKAEKSNKRGCGRLNIRGEKCRQFSLRAAQFKSVSFLLSNSGVSASGTVGTQIQCCTTVDSWECLVLLYLLSSPVYLLATKILTIAFKKLALNYKKVLKLEKKGENYKTDLKNLNNEIKLAEWQLH